MWQFSGWKNKKCLNWKEFFECFDQKQFALRMGPAFHVALVIERLWNDSQGDFIFAEKPVFEGTRSRRNETRLFGATVQVVHLRYSIGFHAFEQRQKREWGLVLEQTRQRNGIEQCWLLCTIRWSAATQKNPPRSDRHQRHHFDIGRSKNGMIDNYRN